MDILNITQANTSEWQPDSKNVDINEWFLMGSPVPVLSIMAAYWLFVIKVGPSLMSKRSPLTLRNTMAAYNFGQIILAVTLFSKGATFMWNNGFIQTECIMENIELKNYVTNGVYLYFITKITELSDTIFFILRKKYNQASFLHIYHHSITVITTWIALKYEPNTNTAMFVGTLNSFVHIIMYTYYALSAYPQLTKYLWWKKYITKLQLVQFAVMLVHLLIEYNVTKCKPSYIIMSIIPFNLVFFLYLFSDFYSKTYKETNVANRKTKHVD
ncbi:elongation of very long chain fatty acids protein AAEL008004-like [Pieris brassicae]|uniref:elongation of very long chain fatty acids protein AAEL008004-like n=1 Tax=Pieris brassicae TaxID=7116 RepID=UPI001E661962|nr:elongation of very long chain fatty acids protein AAEL008004-like [Pieris brassicae]